MMLSTPLWWHESKHKNTYSNGSGELAVENEWKVRSTGITQVRRDRGSSVMELTEGLGIARFIT